MTRDEIFEAIAAISANYTVFQCVECAAAIKKWLKSNNLSGIHLQIEAVGRIKFIVSQRWKEGVYSVAQTGIHQGIETNGRVFDNLGRVLKPMGILGYEALGTRICEHEET